MPSLLAKLQQRSTRDWLKQKARTRDFSLVCGAVAAGERRRIYSTRIYLPLARWCVKMAPNEAPHPTPPLRRIVAENLRQVVPLSWELELWRFAAIEFEF